MESTKKIITIGIDFGSTYSGFAYSYNDNITSIFTSNNEKTGYKKYKTEILINKHTEEVKKWGDGAYETFLHMNENEKQENLYFKDLKLNLDPNISNNIICPVNCTNNPYPLKVIISKFLKEIKNKAIGVVNGLPGNIKISDNNINWSITVPSIWNEFGKQFMRECAKIAGMNDVKIVLEPEAASLTMLNDSSIDQRFKEHGKVFMLIDAGGYTVDFTVNEIIKDFDTGEINLKQLSPPSGGAWGSSLINRDINDIIEEIFGKKYTDCFKSNDEDEINALMDTMNDIEKEKKSCDLSYIDGSYRISADYDNKDRNEIQLKNGDIVKYKRGKLVFSGKLFYKIFKKRIEPIIEHISKLINQINTQIDQIVLVGGFACNEILSNEIINKFEIGLRKVSILTSPESSVINGSVIYNYNPSMISYRKSPLTYGKDTYTAFNEKIHIGRPIKNDDDNEPFVKIFDIYLTIGEDVKNGYVVKKKFVPFYNNQKRISFCLYSTKKKYPKYCDEKDVKKLGEITLEMDDLDKPKKEREAEVSIEFGSCLLITAKNLNTGKTIKTTFNYFLNK